MSNAEFTMPLLTEAQIEEHLRRRRSGVIALRVVAGVIVLCGVGWRAVRAHNLELFILDLLLGCLGLLALSVLIDSILESYGLTAAEYEWLPAHRCEDLATLCETHQGLIRYRNQIRDAGRRFTKGECAAMERWVRDQLDAEYLAKEEAKERAGCQKLYGVGVEA